MMTTTLRALITTLPALRRALGPVYGWRWPLALARGLARSRQLVRGTRWAIRSDAEARLVGVLALFPAVVLDARQRLRARHGSFGRELLASVLEAHWRRIAPRLRGGNGHSDGAGDGARAGTSADGSVEANGVTRERWHAFVDRCMLQGVGAFNETECLSVDDDRLHLRVTRCLVADLARDAGVPELAQEFCLLSAATCQSLLPRHVFHRGGSPRHTLAYGHALCDYVWERTEPVEQPDRAAAPASAASTDRVVAEGAA